MDNFQYLNPTRVLFGKGQLAAVNRYVPAGARVLLLYGGGSIKANGVYDAVRKALSEHAVAEFGGIEANPEYETLLKATTLGRQEKSDFILAVGGGSVLDGAKLIAAAIPFAGAEPWDLVIGKAKITQAVPLASVLTLPGTGSEMNSYAVISRRQTNEKRSFGSSLLFPVFSILDPETTFSLPARQVANGVADAFTHVIEQYLTFPHDAPVQDRMAEGILLTLIEEGPKTLANLTDYPSRANVMWCATLALNGLIGVGVPQDWSTHTIGHELTALHGIDHARTLAVVLPHLLRVRKEAKREKLLQYAARVWNLTQGSEEERIEAGIARTAEFFHSLGIPTRATEYRVGQETVDEIVRRFEERNLQQLSERRDLGPTTVREILERSIH